MYRIRRHEGIALGPCLFLVNFSLPSALGQAVRLALRTLFLAFRGKA
jgi:hypothetical protein